MLMYGGSPLLKPNITPPRLRFRLIFDDLWLWGCVFGTQKDNKSHSVTVCTDLCSHNMRNTHTHIKDYLF